MRALLLALVLLLVAAAGDVRAEGSTTTTRRGVMHAPLRTSGHLPVTSTCQPVILGMPDATGWRLPIDTLGAGATQGAGTTFELGPFTPETGGTARYAARITSDAMAPKLTTPGALASLWTGDWTLITVGQLGGASQRMTFSHGTANADGVYMSAVGASAVTCVTSRAGAADVFTGGGGAFQDRIMVGSCRRVGTTCSARANGVKGADTPCASVVAPTTRQAWFGRYEAAGFYLNGPLALAVVYPCGLADAELTRAEALWGGSVAEERNVTDDRNSTACAEPPDGNIACYGDDFARCGPPGGCLSEETRTNSLASRLPCAALVGASGTGSCTDSDSAGSANRYLGANDAAIFTDSDGLAQYGRYTTLALGAGTFTESVYFKAGTLTEFEMWVYNATDGTRKATFTGIGTTPTTVSAGATVRATGLAGWYRASFSVASTTTSSYWLVGGDAAADQGTIYFAAPQVEAGATASSWIPTVAAPLTRVADKITEPTHGWPVQQGEIEFTFTPAAGSWTATYAGLLDSRAGAGTGVVSYITTATGALVFGVSTTSTISAVLSWTAGVTYRIVLRWGGGNLWLYRDGVLVASNTTGTVVMPTSHDTDAELGASGGLYQPNGWLSLTRVSR